MNPVFQLIGAGLLCVLPCKAEQLFEKHSNGIVFEVVSAHGQPWWGGRSQNSSAYFRFSGNGVVLSNYAFCGIIFGVLVEGLAMSPDAKEIDSGPSKEWSVKFIGKEDRIELTIKKMTVVLTRAEALRLVNALMVYWEVHEKTEIQDPSKEPVRKTVHEQERALKAE